VIQTKFFNDLPDLLQRVITYDKKHFQFTASNDTPLHNLSITSDNDTILFQSDVYQVFIIAVVKKPGVITYHSQPFSEFTDIQVNDKSGIFSGMHILPH
jgi:hypothetical protein